MIIENERCWYTRSYIRGVVGVTVVADPRVIKGDDKRELWVNSDSVLLGNFDS